MVSKDNITNLVSSGAVVYKRQQADLVLIALCGRLNPPTWNLPKGTPEQEESLEETALREVQEETGLEVQIEGDLGYIEYWFSRPSEARRFHKRVYFYLMSAIGGSVELHDQEFDVVEWIPIEKAFEILTHPTEAEVIRRAFRALEIGVD